MTLNVCKRKHYENYFVRVKLSWCTPPQLFQIYFLRMEISIRINLIRLPKHSFIGSLDIFDSSKNIIKRS